MRPGEASYGHFLTPEKITHIKCLIRFIVAAEEQEEDGGREAKRRHDQLQLCFPDSF